jgi:hypothetical protein
MNLDNDQAADNNVTKPDGLRPEQTPPTTPAQPAQDAQTPLSVPAAGQQIMPQANSSGDLSTFERPSLIGPKHQPATTTDTPNAEDLITVELEANQEEAPTTFGAAGAAQSSPPLAPKTPPDPSVPLNTPAEQNMGDVHPAGASAASVELPESANISSNQKTSGPTHIAQAAAPAGGRPGKKKKMMLIGGAFMFLLLASAGAVFGWYLPNQPENVWNTGLDRSGSALTQLIQQATEEDKMQQIEKSELTATAEFKGYGSEFNGQIAAKVDTNKSDGGVKLVLVNEGESNHEISLDFLTERLEGKNYPETFFRVSGLDALGLGFFMPGLEDIEGQWIEISSDYWESLGSRYSGVEIEEEPARDNLSSRDVAELARTIASSVDEYLLTSDSDKAVLENRGFIGEETIDGLSTYRYEAGINHENANKFCKDLSMRVIDSEGFKKLSGVKESGVEDLKTEANESCDGGTKSEDLSDKTFDLWIDAKSKLIHKVRFYDENNRSTYIDVGQTYEDDSITFFVNYHDDDSKYDIKSHVTVNVGSTTTKGEVSFMQEGEDGFSGKITFEAKPYDGEITVERPTDAISIEQLLSALGYGDVQPTNNNLEL